MNKVLIKIGFFTWIFILASCVGDSNPGFEFMPNMYRSPSLETYSEHNIEGYNGLPVEGTIARGYLLSTINFDKLDGTLEGYIYAGDSVVNPIENNEDNLAEGKELYGMMCSHCHGDNGEGDGKMKKHAAYSGVPAYNDDVQPRRTDGPMNELKAGHLFHAITYGVGNMGSHASQVTEEERWLIVNYIQQELQHYGSKK
jgi:mono/diheme cytochrome c family protein